MVSTLPSGKEYDSLREIVRALRFIKIDSPVLCAGGRPDTASLLTDSGFSAVRFGPAERETYSVCVLPQLDGSDASRSLLAQVRSRISADGCILAAFVLDERKGAPGTLTYTEADNLLFASGYDHICRLRKHRRGRHAAVLLAKPAHGAEGRNTLSIIVPVYNEASTVRAVLDRLAEKTFPGVEKELVIVESNSTDGTREIVREYAKYPFVRLAFEERPEGKGHGVRTGLSCATGAFIAIQDGDLEYDIDDYDKLLPPLLRYEEAFVLGSRHEEKRQMRTFKNAPLTARVMNAGHVLFTGMINVCCGSKLKDPFTMFKLFRRDCIWDVDFYCNRFDFDWEVVLKLLRKGYHAREIGIHYESRSFAEGKKVRFIRDPLNWMRALLLYGFWYPPRSEKRIEKAYKKA